MSSIQLVFRYEDHEASADIPLSIPLQEMLRRVKLKQGPNPHDETAYQATDEIRREVDGQRLVKRLLRELVLALDG